MDVSLQILAAAVQLFLFAIGVGVVVVAVLYVIDVRQTQHAVRRNYPVIDHHH